MFEFRPAVRDKTSVLIALAGASGSGKTYTAILMAFGLAYPGMAPAEIIAAIAAEGKSRVCFIDTEGGRGKHYAPGPGITPDFKDTFPFEYGEITAPYTPEVYQEAMTAADQAGFAVIIIDSMSHEYESEGGIMEMADEQEAGKLKPDKTLADTQGKDGWQAWDIKPVKSPGNWKQPKTRHKKMVNRAVQLRAHVIFCLRAEEKMLLKQDPQFNSDGSPKMWNGKQQTKMVVVPAEERPLLERWAPICEKRFMYEMTVSFLLLPSAPGVGHPIKNLQAQFEPMFPEGQRLGVTNGAVLAAWSTGRAAGDAPKRAQSPASDAQRDVQREPTRSESPPAERSQRPTRTAAQMVDDYEAKAKACQDLDELGDLQHEPRTLKWIGGLSAELRQRVEEIDRAETRRIEDKMAL